MEETENKDEAVHTEQVQDIIGKPPIWLYRWGITFVLVITLLCVIISSFIQYPEVVKTKLTILSVESPHAVFFKDSAQLLRILVQNNQKIKKGQVLAIVESLAGKDTIKAPNDGELIYAGIVHENEQLRPGQHIFYISGTHKDFYGEMIIPPYGASKVKPGQTVRIKLKNYPEEAYNSLQGKIKYVTADMSKNGEYMAEVDLHTDGKDNNPGGIILLHGMIADAEIITVPSTVFHRIFQSLMKGGKIQ
jgi:multidrug efflux pump subunit AcrA (membrane-fusion protein)